MSLKDILEEAGVQEGAEQVVSRSVDGWTCGSPIEAIMDGRDAMLAIAMNGEPLPARHGYVVIGGVAWAVPRGVSQVQIRVVGGEWRDAEMGSVPSNDPWLRWVYRLNDATPGKRIIEARAIDAMGEPQPEEPMAVAPNGAQGYHRIQVAVDS